MNKQNLVNMARALLKKYRIYDDMCSPCHQEWKPLTEEDDIDEIVKVLEEANNNKLED